MKEEDREIWVGGTRLYLGEDNIIYVTLIGETDEKTSMAMKEVSVDCSLFYHGNVFPSDRREGKNIKCDI